MRCQWAQPAAATTPGCSKLAATTALKARAIADYVPGVWRGVRRCAVEMCGRVCAASASRLAAVSCPAGTLPAAVAPT
jgi:hypothetical protein